MTSEDRESLRRSAIVQLAEKYDLREAILARVEGIAMNLGALAKAARENPREVTGTPEPGKRSYLDELKVLDRKEFLKAFDDLREVETAIRSLEKQKRGYSGITVELPE